MPTDWLDAKKGDTPRAEEPDMDPMGDGDGQDDMMLSFDYRRKDRDSVFDGLMQRLDLVAVMITVIIAGAVGYVGIQVMENTVDTAGLQFENTNVENRTGFQNSTADLTDGLSSFFENLGTVFVVIVLVVVIGYLMLLRGR